MEIRFSKQAGGRVCNWVALRPPRSRVPGTAMAAGGSVPHDLATFVIEDALQIAHGFWGCVAEGATFKSLRRPVTRPGRELIRRRRADLDAAELAVNAVYGAWRRGEPPAASAALDAMLTRWRAVPEDGELVVEWRPQAVGRRRARTAAGSSR